mmetsp:Transcript_26426/g.84707  ORF Transcript_26426/g.84707 Transcript_26426/m.84707 type:complete len:237 (+) Transcript_26426:215-925(+)
MRWDGMIKVDIWWQLKSHHPLGVVAIEHHNHEATVWTLESHRLRAVCRAPPICHRSGRKVVRPTTLALVGPRRIAAGSGRRPGDASRLVELDAHRARRHKLGEMAEVPVLRVQMHSLEARVGDHRSVAQVAKMIGAAGRVEQHVPINPARRARVEIALHGTQKEENTAPQQVPGWRSGGLRASPCSRHGRLRRDMHAELTMIACAYPSPRAQTPWCSHSMWAALDGSESWPSRVSS